VGATEFLARDWTHHGCNEARQKCKRHSDECASNWLKSVSGGFRSLGVEPNPPHKATQADDSGRRSSTSERADDQSRWNGNQSNEVNGEDCDPIDPCRATDGQASLALKF